MAEKKRAKRMKRQAKLLKLRNKCKEFRQPKEAWGDWFDRTCADVIGTRKAGPERGKHRNKYKSGSKSLSGVKGGMENETKKD